MIEEISIWDLGVIEHAVLPLGPGYTVVTGETGAGKTMVTSALGLLTGKRADAGSVRHGAKNASVEAIIQTHANSDIAVRATDAGGTYDTDSEADDAVAHLVLSRSVTSEGRSKATVGGRTTPIGVLGEIGDALVAVHGQSDQLRLKGAAEQRESLDRFAGPDLAAKLAEYQHVWDELRNAQQLRDELVTQARERALEAETLRVALEEIDAVDPQPGEDEALKAEATKLANVEGLRTAAMSAHTALVAEEYAEGVDATSLVNEGKRVLEMVSEDDPEIKALADRLAEIGYLMADLSSDLASYASSLDSEGPARLAEVETRRAALNGLTKKYAPTIDGVLEWSGFARERSLELGDDTLRIDELAARIEELTAQRDTLGKALTALRQAAAEDLAARVTTELRGLAMPDASLVVVVEEAEPHRYGADTVFMLLKPHAGAGPRPLGKGASGGELSRVMLALEVVLASTDPVPTFVFDEVDSGVGGKAAVDIGRRLARLAQHVQVIVVTHLPQVAAYADRHVRVIKQSSSESGVTASDIALLTEDERISELARMLAGQEDSESAQAHAKELLQDARAENQQ
ncbi:DNA repair protein RecN [Neomicrococcus aestuarii]|uniref:DNA repair protein RecN n=1 Tax=Neomicrococcus aestuarii TaxID=556325 RepID=A0A1L2ZML7_9MICC|nr:DNA repair protein RecN [Neomicrococcus aestuarii]APF40268.1 DNA repair protein RecN [Neomicrococcus aestuarii]